jgi:hypothetical protein
MTLSVDMRRYMCRDMGITLPVYESPYFEYYANALSGLYDIDGAVRMTEDGIARHGGEKELLAHRDEVVRHMVNAVEKHPDFPAWGPSGRRIGEQVNRRKVTRKNAINMETVGRTFWKIDLVKADYHSLAVPYPQIVSFSSCYEAWASIFTRTEYVVKSKRTRNMVFGKLEPAHQQFLERNTVEAILDVCVASHAVAEEDIYHVMHDEALLSKEPPADLAGRLLEAGVKQPFRVQKVDVRKVEGTNFLYIVEDGKPKPFSVDRAYVAQVWKAINAQPIEAMDLCFTYDDRVASFERAIVDAPPAEQEKGEIVFPGIRTEPFRPMVDRLSDEDRAELRRRLDALRSMFSRNVDFRRHIENLRRRIDKSIETMEETWRRAQEMEGNASENVKRLKELCELESSRLRQRILLERRLTVGFLVGDVVKHSSGRIGNGVYGQVVTDLEGFLAVEDVDGFLHCDPYQFCTSTVVGNVKDNPDLLKLTISPSEAKC